jgi:hypothetical protein
MAKENFADRFKKKDKTSKEDVKDDKKENPFQKAKNKTSKEDSKDTKKENPFQKKDKEDTDAADKDDPSKKKAPDKAKNKVNFEPTTNEDVIYIMSGDVSDINEHMDIVEEFLGEDLTSVQRDRKGLIFNRYRSKIDASRKRSLNRQASLGTLKQRAKRQVVNKMKKRLLNKRGVAFATATASDKNRVERILKKRKQIVDRLVNTSIKNVRQLQKNRLSHKNESIETDGDLVEAFNNVYDSIVKE